MDLGAARAGWAELVKVLQCLRSVHCAANAQRRCLGASTSCREQSSTGG